MIGQRLNKLPDVAGGEVALIVPRDVIKDESGALRGEDVFGNLKSLAFVGGEVVAITPRDILKDESGAIRAEDITGNIHALAFTGGDIESLNDMPKLSAFQHKAGATGSVYGTLRIEWGNDTLSAGSKAVTFQAAFKTILDVFLQDKTSANAMYPSAIGTSGFTANGTGTDDFAWLAIGYD